ncbi:MAG: DUF1289 domain-containing protein [Neisseriaceae bacterium]|nr:DUF1289 domain-containing protein [Neisseriaceae bacterium]MBR6877552.1 DUF1289 domain-containing protein [Neisseriaceae bacterium]
MEQSELFHIESPCVGVCQVNNKGYCLGCLRSRNERLYWHTFSNEQRGLLIKTLAARKAAILRKKLSLQEADLAILDDVVPEQGSLF